MAMAIMPGEFDLTKITAVVGQSCEICEIVKRELLEKNIKSK